MGLKTWIACAALGATVVAGAGVAVAQDGKAAENAVKVRKAQMQIYAYNLGVLGAMAKGDLPYNAETAQNAANALNAASGMRIPGAWLPGTDNVSMTGTRALPAIWENGDDVRAKAMTLWETSTDLADAAGMGLDQMKAAFGPVGGACGACHKAYRAPES